MCHVPHLRDPEKYEKREFCNSEFVEILPDDRIEIAMQYPRLGMKNAEDKCLMRKEAAEKLYAAAAKLPKGYRFRIWDAWRPFALQHELYEVYSKDIVRDFSLENVSEEERNAVIRKFVSDPIPDREMPPVHTTGGAIDLTIVGPDGRELDMGTAFDAFTEKTCTDYFERLDADLLNNNSYNIHDDEICIKSCKNELKRDNTDQVLSKGFHKEDMTKGVAYEWKDEPKGATVEIDYITCVRDNRRLLYKIMTEAGFTNLPSEWWHYDYGDRFWAYYNNCSAIYEGVFTKEEINGGGKYFG